MKFKKGIIKFAAIPILAVVAIVLFNYFTKEAEASFDPSTCITFKEYTASNEIEPGVLFIGIYLINLNGLNDELYDQAKDSASSSGQDVIYYKSDLADGIWVNLDDAGGFADISETAEPVDEKTLANLYVKYYVNKDGIMKDVTDGREVNPFNVINPYDLRNLPELDQLVQQYTGSDTEKTITEKQYLYPHKHSVDNDSIRSDVYYWRTISVFLNLDLSDEETDKLDRQLDRLYEVYKSLKNQDKSEEADLVYSLMESVDAQRRTIVFDKLSQEYSALGELYDIAMGSLYTSYANFKTADNIEDDVEQPDYIIRMRNSLDHDFTETTKKERELKEDKDYTDWWIPIVPDEKIKKKSDSESSTSDDEEEEEEEEVERDAFSQDQTITGAIEACIESCQDSYSEYSAKALKDAESVMAHAIYEYSIKVIETATPDGLSEDATTLKHLYNIKDGTIKEGKAELEILDTILEPHALAAYNTGSKDGPSGEYNAAKAGKKSAAVLDNYLDTQKNKLETKRSDLQFVISARHERMQSSPAYEDTIKKIDEADAMKKAVPETDFRAKARQSVEDYIIWLQEELKRIKDGDKSLGSHLEELQDKKEDLQKEYKAALDDEDLALAADLAAEIQAVDNDIQDELDLIAKKIENAESAGEIADLMAGLGNSLDGLINNLLNDAKEKISAGDLDGLDNIIDALSGVGATDALNDLKDALEEDGGASATLMNDLDNAIEDSLTNGMNATEEEEEKEDASSLSKEKLRAALIDFFGPESGWTEETYAAVITALSRIQASSAASDLAKEYLDKALALKNRYLYQKYKRNARVEYVSLIPISDLTEYRYVYDGNKHEAILYKDLTTIAYEFEVGKTDALKGEQTLTLSTAGLLANGDIFYLSEEDTLEEFKCQAQYVVGREYAVCVTSKVDDRANEFLKLFN